jgi:hypothetical protein
MPNPQYFWPIVFTFSATVVSARLVASPKQVMALPALARLYLGGDGSRDQKRKASQLYLRLGTVVFGLQCVAVIAVLKTLLSIEFQNETALGLLYGTGLLTVPCMISYLAALYFRF